MKNSHLQTSFKYKNNLIKVNWYDLIQTDIPKLSWQQVYVIGDLNGKIPVVYYDTGDKDNLPGGKTEAGETVEQTLQREVKEEINCRAKSWYPIGYQENIEPDGKKVYQLRVRAKLEKLGNFTEDMGGSVIGYRLIELGDLNSCIQYGELGDRMVSMIRQFEGHG